MALQVALFFLRLKTLDESKSVIVRAKFNRVRTLAAREKFLSIDSALFEPVTLTSLPVDTADPRGRQQISCSRSYRPSRLIITGDLDLLSLHPWRGIPILTLADYLAQRL